MIASSLDTLARYAFFVIRSRNLLFIPHADYFQVGPGEAGKVRRAPAVFRHRAADRDAETGGEFRLPVRTERTQAKTHLGGHAQVYSRGCVLRHSQFRSGHYNAFLCLLFYLGEM